MTMYRTLEGKELDLSTLSEAEMGALNELLLAYAQNVPYPDFMLMVYGGTSRVLRGGGKVTKSIVETVLYQAAEDLRFRLGIRQGQVAPDPGDDPATEPLPEDDWIPVAEAARLKNVSVAGLHRAIQAGKLLTRKYEGRRGVWVSRTSLGTYQPSEKRQEAGRQVRSIEYPKGEE